jgi:hypothetical protein
MVLCSAELNQYKGGLITKSLESMKNMFKSSINYQIYRKMN